MNSDAISVPTHSVRAKTALHAGTREEGISPSAATCTLMTTSRLGWVPARRSQCSTGAAAKNVGFGRREEEPTWVTSRTVVTTPSLINCAAMKSGTYISLRGSIFSQVPPREITRLAEARLLACAEHRAKLIADAKRVVEQWRVKDFFGRADVSTSFLLSSVVVGGAADVAVFWIGGPVGGKQVSERAIKHERAVTPRNYVSLFSVCYLLLEKLFGNRGCPLLAQLRIIFATGRCAQKQDAVRCRSGWCRSGASPTARSVALFAQNRNFCEDKIVDVGRPPQRGSRRFGLALAAIHRRLNLHACETAAKRSPLGWILGEGYYLKKSGTWLSLNRGFSLPEHCRFTDGTKRSCGRGPIDLFA